MQCKNTFTRKIKGINEEKKSLMLKIKLAAKVIEKIYECLQNNKLKKKQSKYYYFILIICTNC